MSLGKDGFGLRLEASSEYTPERGWKGWAKPSCEVLARGPCSVLKAKKGTIRLFKSDQNSSCVPPGSVGLSSVLFSCLLFLC